MPDKRKLNNGRGQDEMPKDGSYRTPLLQYVKKKYKTKPDYPWKGDPESPSFALSTSISRPYHF